MYKSMTLMFVGSVESSSVGRIPVWDSVKLDPDWLREKEKGKMRGQARDVMCVGKVKRRGDADMSNDKAGEIPVRRKPKDSRATFFVPGLVGT